MKIAVEVYVSLFILCLTMALCVGFISSDLSVMEARDCFYSYVNEMQNGDLAESVIEDCQKDASNNGYGLDVELNVDDNGKRSADVTLKYDYKMPVLGISQNKTIHCYIN